jgi:hypothetical protein
MNTTVYSTAYLYASVGWDSVVWCEVCGIDMLCREWHVVHVILLTQTSSCKTVGKE